MLLLYEKSTLFSMTMSIIRAGPQSREAVLKFFGDTITKNHSREKIQVCIIIIKKVNFL